MVRKGVVRCFNCGSFTNPEIEARFLEKQESQPPVMYSDLPVTNDTASKKNASSETSLNVRPDLSLTEDEIDEDGDDFELSGSLEFLEGDDEDDDFEFNGALSDPDMEIPSLEEDPSPSEASRDTTFDEGADDEDNEEMHEDDQLFSIAMLEEAESASRKRRQIQTTKRQLAKFIKATNDGIVMLPPCRCCAIRIQPQQLGGDGVCPKCKLTFKFPSPKIQARVIPSSNPVVTSTAKNIDHRFLGTAVVHLKGAYQVWLKHVWLHQIETAKFKPTDDYLPKHYVPVDLGFSLENAVLFPLAKKYATYSTDDAKLEEVRNKFEAKLSEKTPLESMTEFDPQVVTLNQIAGFKLIDPLTSPSNEFNGANIWGQGRIYLEIPSAPEAERRQFLSMTISQYRELTRILAHLYGYVAFARKSPVSLDDKTTELACMFSKKNFTALTNDKYFLQDPSYKLNLVGYCCETCGKFLSEESRTDKKLGSAANKAPAKMKCLSCGKKFGEHPRYEIAKEEEKPASKKMAKTGAK